jgi:hypothetical protein
MRIIPDPNGGRIALQMEDPELTIITTLLADVSQLLSADLPEPDDDPFLRLVGHLDPDQEVTRPHDPALLRLLPDADSSDPQRSAEYRRLTERDLRESKLHSIRIALHSLGQHPGPITLDRDTAHAWMRALTDVRLVLASRVGIASDEDAERLLGDDPHTDGAEVSETEEAILSLYELTTWLQEHITQFMLDGLPDVDGEDPVDGDDDLGDPGDDDPAGDDEDAHGAGGVDPRGPDDPRGDRG